MGVIQTFTRVMNNPEPIASVDDILRPEGDNPLLEHGFVTTNIDTLVNRAHTHRPAPRDHSRAQPHRNNDSSRRHWHSYPSK